MATIENLAPRTAFSAPAIPQAPAYRTAIVDGGAAVMALAEDQF